MGKKIKYNYFTCDNNKLIKSLEKDRLCEMMRQMVMIRHFEMRAESAYQQAKIGGYFHAYIGQEAIQTAAVAAMGVENWWITTYRCHALALLTGATPKECMAELYGKVTGCAQGRGGSMHLYTDHLLGGFGIVGGHLPIAVGAAFSAKYQGTGKVAVCFLGDGAFVQGAVHESLNLASLWNLPVIFVIENNQWGMGTPVQRAICHEPIAESFAPAYNMKGYTFDGMDVLNCYAGFKEVYEEVKRTQRPVLIEAITERFKGHSISDPGLYRSKEELERAKARDPLLLFKNELEKAHLLDEATYQKISEEEKEIVLDAMKFADESPYPDISTLEEGVYAGD
ncbi:MAG: pyruvate dehydrogenase (acetyl-transferring) E1 component subunit alpha [Simkaniaceae bacterium]|nr:pyruvate dehydrogenase (acetyl-transferring) E1 component subunit alpha [Simkaniaceae bacterium]